MTQDKLLWANFINGDASSFEQLYHLYYSELVAYAKRFRRDEQFVAEIIQDLFVKLWQSRQNLGRPESVKFYLLRALRNTAISKFQDSNRELLIDSWESYDPEDYQATDEQAFSLVGEINLNVLTERQREAIHLFYYQNLSYDEMARLMNIRIGAAYKLIYRALEVLRSAQKGHKGPITDTG